MQDGRRVIVRLLLFCELKKVFGQPSRGFPRQTEQQAGSQIVGTGLTARGFRTGQFRFVESQVIQHEPPQFLKVVVFESDRKATPVL